MSLATPNKFQAFKSDPLQSPRTNESTLCSSEHLGELGAQLAIHASPFSNKTFQIEEDNCKANSED